MLDLQTSRPPDRRVDPAAFKAWAQARWEAQVLAPDFPDRLCTPRQLARRQELGLSFDDGQAEGFCSSAQAIQDGSLGPHAP